MAPETLTTVGIGDVGVPIHRCASAAVTRCVLPTPASPTTSTLRPDCTSAADLVGDGRASIVRRRPSCDGRRRELWERSEATDRRRRRDLGRQPPRPLHSSTTQRRTRRPLPLGVGIARVTLEHLCRFAPYARFASRGSKTSVAITDAATESASLPWRSTHPRRSVPAQVRCRSGPRGAPSRGWPVPTYTAPGVYVEEIPSTQKVLASAPTAVAAFVGFTERAPQDDPNDPQGLAPAPGHQLEPVREPVRRLRRGCSAAPLRLRLLPQRRKPRLHRPRAQRRAVR